MFLNHTDIQEKKHVCESDSNSLINYNLIVSYILDTVLPVTSIYFLPPTKNSLVQVTDSSDTFLIESACLSVSVEYQ